MRHLLAASLLAIAAAAPAAARTVAVAERSIDDLQAMMKTGQASSVDLRRA